MLKVGDKVKVREGLENVTTPVIVRESMIKLEGKEVEVLWVRVNSVDGITRYKVKEDLGGWLWTEEMFEKIEEKESDNMKELTFREVIANIKEGEVWENLHKTIEFKNNNFIVKSKIKKQNNYFVVNEYTTFKLKRPQYTFQEAFEAFEKGKEIKSCESGYIYNTTEEGVEDRLFYGYEIQGKWYIND